MSNNRSISPRSRGESFANRVGIPLPILLALWRELVLRRFPWP
jgi:hypothetical protein